MTTFDVICFNQELMDRMNKLGIKLNDTQYMELYKEYSRMLENNEKTTYIVRALSERYNVSERNVYKIIKRFKKRCIPDAV